jgi:hypothetical protein
LAHLIEGVTYEPVFIIGDHRSGTTLLYSLLCSSGAFNGMSVYHAICYRSLLANEAAGQTATAKRQLEARFASLGLTTRLIDNIPLNAETPEEYGLVLHAECKRLQLSDKTVGVFDTLCRKIQYLSGAPARPLIQKNPWDFGSFMEVRRLYPRAKFVFIHRSPLHVINSQLKVMHGNWTEGNLYVEMLSSTFAWAQRQRPLKALMAWATNPESRVALARRVLTRRACKAIDYYFRHIGELPPGDYVALTYEELCREPNAVLQKVFAFLGASLPEGSDYSRDIAPRPVKLLPGLQPLAERPPAAFQKYMAHHGIE